MVKPEWGAKRICHSCGAAFYDLNRDPIVCPKCATVYDPEAVLKSRRSRAPVAEEKVAAVAVVGEDAEVALEAEVEEDDADAADVVADDEDEDEDLIEDASELGEDEDDMAEVIEKIEDDEV